MNQSLKKFPRLLYNDNKLDEIGLSKIRKLYTMLTKE